MIKIINLLVKMTQFPVKRWIKHFDIILIIFKMLKLIIPRIRFVWHFNLLQLQTAPINIPQPIMRQYLLNPLGSQPFLLVLLNQPHDQVFALPTHRCRQNHIPVQYHVAQLLLTHVFILQRRPPAQHFAEEDT